MRDPIKTRASGVNELHMFSEFPALTSVRNVMIESDLIPIWAGEEGKPMYVSIRDLMTLEKTLDDKVTGLSWNYQNLEDCGLISATIDRIQTNIIEYNLTADVTATAGEVAPYGIIKFTGTSVSSWTLTIPVADAVAGRMWFVSNKSPATRYIKVAGMSSGITIPTSAGVWVYTDGAIMTKTSFTEEDYSTGECIMKNAVLNNPTFYGMKWKLTNVDLSADDVDYSDSSNPPSVMVVTSAHHEHKILISATTTCVVINTDTTPALIAVDGTGTTCSVMPGTEQLIHAGAEIRTEAHGMTFGSGAPQAAVAATAVLTSDTTAVSDGSTITVGANTYTFKAAFTSPDVANEILRGADHLESIANLRSLFKGDATPGVEVSIGTTIPTDTDASSYGDSLTIVSVGIPADVANAWPCSTTDPHLSFAHATFIGGVNATASNPGRVQLDSTSLHVATDVNTIHDSSAWGILDMRGQHISVDDSEAAADYETNCEISTVVVIKDINGNDATIQEATGSNIIITISNATGDSLVLNSSGSDVINGVSTITMDSATSIRLLDFEAGFWAVV